MHMFFCLFVCFPPPRLPPFWGDTEVSGGCAVGFPESGDATEVSRLSSPQLAEEIPEEEEEELLKTSVSKHPASGQGPRHSFFMLAISLASMQASLLTNYHQCYLIKI